MIVIAKRTKAADVRLTTDELYMLMQCLSEVCDGGRFAESEFVTVFSWEAETYRHLLDEVTAAYQISN